MAYARACLDFIVGEAPLGIYQTEHRLPKRLLPVGEKFMLRNHAGLLLQGRISYHM